MTVNSNLKFPHDSDIVPYLNTAWQIDPKNSLALSYTRRLGLTWRFGKTSINFKHARKTEVSDKL